MDKIKIIVVDDHQIVRDGIYLLVMNVPEIEIMGEAGNGDELFELLKKQQPDVIVLDLSLPKISGLEICRILHKDFSHIKVIVFSSYNDEDSIVNALKAGAKGYIPKDVFREELVTAIKAVKEGHEYLSNSIPNTILLNFIKKDREKVKFDYDKIADLTKREIEVLKLIAEGLSYKEIAEQLFISFRTVETHKNNILQKLSLRTTVDLVKYAIKNKLIEL
ncbi:MAG: response regulator transcription factor [Bacteroidales bacterium]|nr:response regulator transcription factor [Bacteroidales bacterium]